MCLALGTTHGLYHILFFALLFLFLEPFKNINNILSSRATPKQALGQVPGLSWADPRSGFVKKAPQGYRGHRSHPAPGCSQLSMDRALPPESRLLRKPAGSHPINPGRAQPARLTTPMFGACEPGRTLRPPGVVWVTLGGARREGRSPTGLMETGH